MSIDLGAGQNRPWEFLGNPLQTRLFIYRRAIGADANSIEMIEPGGIRGAGGEIFLRNGKFRSQIPANVNVGRKRTVIFSRANSSLDRPHWAPSLPRRPAFFRLRRGSGHFAFAAFHAFSLHSCYRKAHIEKYIFGIAQSGGALFANVG